MKKGDAIIISTDGVNILIDGGYKSTFKPVLKKELDALIDKKERLNLLVLTHFDQDHIGGLLTLLNTEKYSSLVDQVWFNRSSELDKFVFEPSLDLSITQSLNFEESVDRLKQKHPSLKILESVHTEIFPNSYQLGKNLKIDILSPTPSTLAHLANEYEKEIRNYDLSGDADDSSMRFSDLWDNKDLADDSASNGSSIAFVLTTHDKSYAFLGDAHSDTVAESLKKMRYSEHNKLKLELLKISHHGSKYNTTNELLNLINCQNFFVSSSAQVSKETIAKVIKSQPGNVKVFCNYGTPIKYFKFIGDYQSETVEFIEGDHFNG